MCIGNMRSGTEALCVYFHTHDREVLCKALTYFGVIGLFAIGAGLGALLVGAHGRTGHLGLLRTAGRQLFHHVHPGRRKGVSDR